MARVRSKSGTSNEDPDLGVRPEQGAQANGNSFEPLGFD